MAVKISVTEARSHDGQFITQIQPQIMFVTVPMKNQFIWFQCPSRVFLQVLHAACLHLADFVIKKTATWKIATNFSYNMENFYKIRNYFPNFLYNSSPEQNSASYSRPLHKQSEVRQAIEKRWRKFVTTELANLRVRTLIAGNDSRYDRTQGHTLKNLALCLKTASIQLFD